MKLLSIIQQENEMSDDEDPGGEKPFNFINQLMTLSILDDGGFISERFRHWVNSTTSSSSLGCRPNGVPDLVVKAHTEKSY